MIYVLILFLPNGDVELVYKNNCMFFDFDQRWNQGMQMVLILC